MPFISSGKEVNTDVMKLKIMNKTILYQAVDVSFNDSIEVTDEFEEQTNSFVEFIEDNFDLAHSIGQTVFLRNNWFSSFIPGYMEVGFRAVDTYEYEEEGNTITKIYVVLDVTFKEDEINQGQLRRQPSIY